MTIPRHPDEVTVTLIADPRETMSRLRGFVRIHALAGCGSEWREIVRTFADKRTFVDFSVRRAAGRPRVLIEFGVHHDAERHVVGFFDAFWSAAAEDFERLEAACLEGRAVSLDDFATQVLPYLDLPAQSVEVSPESA